MKKYLYINLLFLLLIAACGKNERQVALDRIKKIKDADSLYLPENRGKLIDSLFRENENFIVQFPQDSLVEGMLMNNVSLQLYMGRYQGVIKILDRMKLQFPDGKLAPLGLLMKGNVYHDQLNQFAEAEKCWKELIEKFPNSKEASDAKPMIENIGASPAELLKIVTKQKSDSSVTKK